MMEARENEITTRQQLRVELGRDILKVDRAEIEVKKAQHRLKAGISEEARRYYDRAKEYLDNVKTLMDTLIELRGRHLDTLIKSSDALCAQVNLGLEHPEKHEELREKELTYETLKEESDDISKEITRTVSQVKREAQDAITYAQKVK